MSNNCERCGQPLCDICGKPVPQIIQCCGPQGPQGYPGPQGPPGPQGTPGEMINAYAEYNTFESVSNSSNVPFENIYDVGGLTSVSANGEIFTLKAGYVYQFCYTIQGEARTDYRFQVIPSINNVALISNATSSTNIAIDSSAIGSVSSCLLVEAKTDTVVKLLFNTNLPGTVSLVGSVYIHPIAKLV